MHDAANPLIIPDFGAVYQALAPWTEAFLRVIVGLALVPHGLRMSFGFFPNTGLPIRNLSMLADQLDRTGYRPGRLWAPAISIRQLISCVERRRVGRYFWNTLGLEYTLMWTAAALFFLVHGVGAHSLDHLLLDREF
jgi:uncharacterized membrane protein YphA (DoxX/SURF4 family)